VMQHISLFLSCHWMLIFIATTSCMANSSLGWHSQIGRWTLQGLRHCPIPKSTRSSACHSGTPKLRAQWPTHI